MKTPVKHLLIALIGLIGVQISALGQNYPDKPVKILVGYPPGGAPDNVARPMGEALSRILGQQFVVENKAGAGGSLATALAAKSPADGYTLLLGETGQLEIAPFVVKPQPYDTLRDLTPISIVGTTPVILVTNSKSQIRSIKDLVREAKANPGKLNYGSSGIGSFHHLMFEAFNAAAGVKLTHVPFKGSGQIVLALLAGEVQVMATVLPVVDAHRQAGAVNLIAVSSAERYPFAPDVPSISDDLRGFDFSSDLGIVAPAGLSPEVLAKLSRAIKVATETQEMQERFRKMSMILTWTTPEAYRERISQNLKKWQQAIRVSNIQAN